VSMSETYSISHTFTIVDVGKVLDCFAADFDGMGQSTGLRTRENTKALAGDVKLMAQSGYLSEVNVYLKNADGLTIRAAKYEVITSAGMLIASRPGNYLWPRTPGGQLCLHVTCSQEWWLESELRKAAFRQRLSQTWGTLDLDTSFPMLRRQLDRNYVSNSFGLMKTNFL
jgi:hypothetical protein